MQTTEYRATLLADWIEAVGYACTTGRAEEIAEILGLDLACEDRVVEMVDELMDFADTVHLFGEVD